MTALAVGAVFYGVDPALAQVSEGGDDEGASEAKSAADVDSEQEREEESASEQESQRVGETNADADVDAESVSDGAAPVSEPEARAEKEEPSGEAPESVEAASEEESSEALEEPEGEAESNVDEPAGSEDEFPVDEEFLESEEEEELEFGAVAEVQAPPREPTKRTMDKEQLTRIPGTRGDALRSIEIMPGVARTEFTSNGGPPMLRGGSSNESLVLLDGAPVPLIYHFGGLTSFFNSHLLESVEMTPGNYSARYGRAAGGVVEARVRDPKSDRFHAMIELSAIDTFALMEAPVAKDTSVAIAARRSNIDFFFDAVVPDDAYNVLAAPVYWDYQAIVAHRFNERHKLRVLGYGSQDTLKLLFDDSAPEDPALSGSIDGRVAFHRAQVELESQFSETVQQSLMVSVGPTLGDQTIGQLSSKFRFWDVNARAEWAIFAADWLRLDTGLDFQMFGGTGRYKGPVPQQDEGNPSSDTLASERFITIEETGLTPVRPAAFAEASISPTDSILLLPGVRADYIGDGKDWTVDPRLSGRFQVAEDTTLKSGVGLYSQPPQYFEIMEELGNPDAKPFRTLQTSAGVEQKFGEFVRVDLDGFYKRWEDRLIGTEGAAPPRFVNEGTGRAYGLEFLLDVRPSKKTQAFASYTFSRSERKDGAEASWRLFDADQTHNLSLTANYDLGSGWLAGARFRYVTGNPHTPVVGAVYDANNDTYRGLHADVNSARSSDFHQLDVRVEKLWTIGPVGLTTYLEVMNVYNAENQEGESYSFDFSESSGVTGMPIFPNLGIRGEL